MPILGTIASGISGHLAPSYTTWINNVIYSGSANININAKGNAQGDYLYSSGGGGGLGNYPSFWRMDISGNYLQKQYLSNYGGKYVDGSVGDINGNTYIGLGGGGSSAIVKIDSSGTVLWTKNYGTTFASLFAVSPDGSKIIARCTNYESDTPVYINTSDGSVAWSKSLSGGGLGTFNTTGAAISSTRVFTCNYQRNGTNYASIRKLYTDGTTEYSKQYFTNSVATNMFINYSNNAAYVGGYTASSSFFTYFSPSGSAQWTKYIGTTQQYPQQGCVDSSGNIYLGHNDGTKAYIIKFDASGTVLWQRSIVGSANTSNSGNISLLSDDYIYVTFAASDGSYVSAYQAVLPTDGSKTGTYTVGGKSITYASSSLTIGTAGNSWSSTVDYSSNSISASNTTAATIGNFTNTTGFTSI